MSEYEHHRVRPGVFRAIRALGYSIAGLRATWKHEEAFRQEVFFILVLLPLGLWLGHNGVERALLAGCLLLVLIVEVLNSALEAAVDRFGPEHNHLVGRAKDMGSAAVLLALCNVGLVWGLVLLG